MHLVRDPGLNREMLAEGCASVSNQCPTNDETFYNEATWRFWKILLSCGLPE